MPALMPNHVSGLAGYDKQPRVLAVTRDVTPDLKCRSRVGQQKTR